MKKTILIVSVLALLAGGCKNRATNGNTSNNNPADTTVMPVAVATNGEIRIEIAEENWQKDSIWNCQDNNTVLFQKFNPDTLTGFRYMPFNTDESYSINGLKLLFGYYNPSDAGEYSKYDSETDYGKRLICFNSNNQMIYRSRGNFDLWLFAPHFFISNDKRQIVIICQGGFEYLCCSSAFLIEDNKTYYLGSFDIETYNSNEDEEWSSTPISSVTKIKRINRSLEFSFDADSLIYSPGSEDAILVNNIKLVYKNGKLAMEK